MLYDAYIFFIVDVYPTDLFSQFLFLYLDVRLLKFQDWVREKSIGLFDMFGLNFEVKFQSGIGFG